MVHRKSGGTALVTLFKVGDYKPCTFQGHGRVILWMIMDELDTGKVRVIEDREFLVKYNCGTHAIVPSCLIVSCIRYQWYNTLQGGEEEGGDAIA